MLLALLAALAFGATTPFVQRAGAGVGPFVTAALLYAGAALASGARVRSASHDAPLLRAHAPRLLAMALVGAVIAPAALAWGLQRTSGTAAGLLLALEPVVTVLLGAVVLREHVGRRVAVAATTMAVGAALLASSASTSAGASSMLGLAAVAIAACGWSLDNVLAYPLAQVDPFRVVLAKGALGAVFSAALACARGESLPSLGAGLALLACGATGYGLSLRLYLLAQRRLGATRTASIFGVAPFVSAAVAIALGQPTGGIVTAIAAALFAIALHLHATEHHEHPHMHDAVEHEHPHRHDDGHHDHAHDDAPFGEHSHAHRHEAVEHAHAHAPDVHHSHRH